MATKPKDSSKSGSSPAGNPRQLDIRKMGYLKKLKTMKKKFFVLREDSDSGPARLEYFDNDKKWRAGAPPKQVYEIRTCFNINRKIDAKHKHVLALYTKDKCFALVMDNEEELDEWLVVMLELQNGPGGEDGENPPKPNFEHVWQVDVKCRGLGSSRNLAGRHQLCLTAKVLTLVRKKAQANEQDMLKLPLWSIRRCGHSDKFFYVELGRSAVTGAGELWMQTEDTVIAQNMHEAILGAMKSSNTGNEVLGPSSRPRSASTSEKSKPIATRHRPIGVVPPQPLSVFPPHAPGRERCDSMPTRFRTVSEGHHDLMGTSPNSRLRYGSSLSSNSTYERLRPHSVYGRTMSYSPPNNPLGLVSGACSTDSAGSSHSIDDFEMMGPGDFVHSRYGHSLQQDGVLHTEPSIKEENAEEYIMMAPGATERHSRIIPNLPLNSCTTSKFSLQTSPLTESATDAGTPGEYLNMAPSYLHASTPSSMYRNFSTKSLDLGSSPSSPAGQSDYLDMASPSGASHQESTSEYVPMSPLGTSASESSYCQMEGSQRSYVTAENTPDGSSLTEEDADGYVPMAPACRSDQEKTPSQLSDEGYLSMAPLSTSLPKSGDSYIGMASPKRGTQSLQDVTLSSSPRPEKLEHFRLDKVKSYISPSEDESTSYIKPVRAYSIGSRPQLRKSHLTQHLEAARVRACSVGSQAKPNFRKGPTPIETELGMLKDIDAKASRKSSSAPLLGVVPLRARLAASKMDEAKFENPVGLSSGSAWVPAAVQDGEKTRRYSVGSRQRSNSRSSAGPSPMSSLTEFLENMDSKEKSAELASCKPVGAAVEPEAQKLSERESRDTAKSNDDSNQYVEMSSLPLEALQVIDANQNLSSVANSSPLTGQPSTPANKTVIVSSSELEGDYVDLDLGHAFSGPVSSMPKLLSVASINASVSSTVAKTKSQSGNQLPNNSANGVGNVLSMASRDYVNYAAGQISSLRDSSSLASWSHGNPCGNVCVVGPSYEKQESPSPVPTCTNLLFPASALAATSSKGAVVLGGSNSALAQPNATAKLPKLSGYPGSSAPIKKQMSAPAMPSTLTNEIGSRVSPARKTSCPVMSVDRANSPKVCDPCSSGRPFPASPMLSAIGCKKSSRSPDRNSWTATSSSGDSGSEPVTAKYPGGLLGFSASSSKERTGNCSDASYENVSIGSGSAPGSRPPSVSSERELNYASLDLAPASGDEEKSTRSPRTTKSQGVAANDKDQHLAYAEIDFTKSEGLRNTSGSLREGRV